jgi:hypothetical protein
MNLRQLLPEVTMRRGAAICGKMKVYGGVRPAWVNLSAEYSVSLNTAQRKLWEK